jgi:mannosyltransferase OCH1-like enzyme
MKKDDRTWAQRNPEKMREYRERYNRKHPERVRAAKKRWAKNNPDYWKNRRHKK